MESGSGLLNFDTSNGGQVVIQLLNDGNLMAGTYSFTIANGQANGFKLNGNPVSSYTYNTDFTLSSSNFTFSGVTLTVDGSNNLVLAFTASPTPEPATVLGIAAVALGWVR